MCAHFKTEPATAADPPIDRPGEADARVPLRLVVAGAFGGGNLGADGALAAILETISRLRPDAEIQCFCEAPGIVSRCHRIPAAAMSWRSQWRWLRRLDGLLLGLPRQAVLLASAVTSLRGADILIVPGAHLMDDYPSGVRASRTALATWLLLARAAKK